jgi:hypothetical protein
MNGRRLAALGALLLVGCTHAVEREPVHVRAGQRVELTGVDITKQPIIIEFHEGDVLPLDIVVAGDVIASADGVSVPLTAKRTFFVRVDSKGLKLSLDGKDFDTKPRVPGTFTFGLGVTKEGTRASLRIATPVHR